MAQKARQMIITDIHDFLTYYEKIRARTKRVIAVIPPDQLEWTYAEGKFTFGDLIRHLACIERYMYAETIQSKPSRYKGCGQDLASGYDNVLGFFDQLHEESVSIFQKVDNPGLQEKCLTPGGAPITIWKWLRAMIEHEVHHRGQIYVYLGMLGIKTPPLYGLTSEEVIDRSI